jgi:hypothetical protein
MDAQAGRVNPQRDTMDYLNLRTADSAVATARENKSYYVGGLKK